MPVVEKNLAARILVVEDDADVRSLLQMVLEGHGYRVSTAATGKRALEIVRAGSPPSLILLDLTLPDIDGGGVLGQLRSDPAYDAVKVLLCSGWDKLTEQAQRQGADGALRKPYDLDNLERTIRDVLDSPSRPRVVVDDLPESVRIKHQ